jgi:hypothetical protein
VQENWQQFIGPENVNMVGHMLPYPVTIKNTGKIELVPRVQDIPDFPGAKMAGSLVKLPNVLMT